MTYLYFYISIDSLHIEKYKENQYCCNNFPDYYVKSLVHRAERCFNEDKIYLICSLKNIRQDQLEILKKYNVIDIIDFDGVNLHEIQDIIGFANRYCGSDFGVKSFFLLTTLRYMLCQYFINRLNISKFIFVEGDNLIYEKVTDQVFNRFCNDNLAICNHSTDNAYSSGIFLCDSANKLGKLTEFQKLHPEFDDMSILNAYQNKFNDLIILPQIPDDIIDKEDNLIFDPSSFGQFLGGSNNFHNDSFIDKNHRLYKMFLSKYKQNEDFRIEKINSNYYLNMIKENKSYKFFNLHIHNKQNIDRFL